MTAHLSDLIQAWSVYAMMVGHVLFVPIYQKISDWCEIKWYKVKLKGDV